MDKDITDIIKRVEKHLFRKHQYDEQLFNLGVELGRQLEKKGTDDFRLQIFLDKESEENLYNDKSTQIRKVEDTCLFLVRQAVKEYVIENNRFELDPNYPPQKLPDAISEKWHVQYVDVTQQQPGGDFDAVFEVNGDLADILSRYNVSQKITVAVNNSTGEDEETIFDQNDVDSIYSASIHISAHDTNRDLLELKELADEIEKSSLFKRMSAK